MVKLVVIVLHRRLRKVTQLELAQVYCIQIDPTEKDIDADLHYSVSSRKDTFRRRIRSSVDSRKVVKLCESDCRPDTTDCEDDSAGVSVCKV